MVQSRVYSPALVGPTGPQGAQGAQGPAGAPGIVIGNWRDGTSNPLDSLGDNGDFFLNTASYEVFEKVTGAYVSRGFLSPSLASVTGVWRDGVTQPENSLGLDGDFYLWTVSREVYERVAGVYISRGFLQQTASITGVWRDGTSDPSNVLGGEGDYYLNTTTREVFEKELLVYTSRGFLASSFGPITGIWRDGTANPLNSLGLDGDFYLNTTTNEVFERVTGVYTSRGFLFASAASINGIWRDGSGNPLNALGLDGDFYLNTTSREVFERVTGIYVSRGFLSAASGGTTGVSFYQTTTPVTWSNNDFWINSNTGVVERNVSGVGVSIGHFPRLRSDGGTITATNQNVVLNGINATLGVQTRGVFIGLGARGGNGSNNIAIGYNAQSDTVVGNLGNSISIGAETNLLTQSGTGSIAIGHQAMRNLISPNETMAIGFQAMLNAGAIGYTGSLAIGHLAGGGQNSFINGSSGTVLGMRAGQNGFASNDVLIGRICGNYASGATSFGENVFIGSRTGCGLSTGMSSLTQSVGIGSNALGNSQNGSRTVAIGFNALRNVFGTGQDTVAIGNNVCRDGSSSFNTSVFIGSNVCQANTQSSMQSMVVIGANAMSGTFSAGGYTNGVVIGTLAMNTAHRAIGASNFIAIGNSVATNGIDSNDIAIGAQALRYASNLVTGTNNIAIGFRALGDPSSGVTSGFSNVAIGPQAGATATTAANNVFIGNNAGRGGIGTTQLTGQNNVFIGSEACALTQTISSSVIIGFNSYSANTSGNNNIAIGSNILPSLLTITGSIAIGTGLTPSISNQIILGTTSQTALQIPRFTAAGTLQTDAAGNITTVSDLRMKNHISYIENARVKLKMVRGALFKWTLDSGMEPNGIYAGYYAQEIQMAVPEAVQTDYRDGMLSVQDRGVIALLINAVNELGDAFDNHIAQGI